MLLLLAIACKHDPPVDTTDPLDDLEGHLLGILVTPEQAVVPVGGQVQLGATGLLDDRSSVDLTAAVDWQSRDAAVVRVEGGLDLEGVVTGAALGATEVWATAVGVESVPAHVTVTDAALLGLAIEPKAVALPAGEELQLVAQSLWSDGGRADSSGQVRWLTGDGGVAQIAAGGRLIAAGPGHTEIHAEWDAVTSEPVPVDVSPADDRPDLRIDGVSADSGGGNVTLTVTVGNAGRAGASEFFVDVFVDPTTAPEVGDYGDEWSLVDYIGPDGTTQVPFTFEATQGPHSVWLVVDSTASVDESDETDNTSGQTIEVGGVAGPDLTVIYFDWLADDEAIYYAVDIYNAGSEAVGTFYVDMYVDALFEPVVPSDGDEWVQVPALGAGETVFADFLFETTCPYGCWSWVLVDSYDEVAETNEANNTDGPLDVYSY